MTCSLIFFLLIATVSCRQRAQNGKITIIWKEERAVGISFFLKHTEAVSEDSILKRTEIRLSGVEKQVAILGELFKEGEAFVFMPLIPFTRGLHYELWLQNQHIGDFDIPVAVGSGSPVLVSIFPSQDTLPENLLKVYLHFSKPMREGQSGKYVMLLKNKKDTIHGAFLDLQPELWNPERTILTLWLDPGRIKRDLQPNKLLGAPLQKNEDYRLEISSRWQDTQGTALHQPYTKSFTTAHRDSISPDPRSWQIVVPKAGTQEVLKIDFRESLDHSLLLETLSVQTRNGQLIAGKWMFIDEESKGQFQPDGPWIPEDYLLRVATKLEDLAGNNLNRPFDRDVTRKSSPVMKDFVSVPFTVKKM